MAALTGPDVVRERVREQLGRIPGEVTAGEDGGFLVARGTRVTAVLVIGLQPDVTLVAVYAVLATDVADVDGACRFLATRDLDLPLVHFELVDDGKALIAVQGLLGEFLSGPDLAAAVDAVSDAAETLGPEVDARPGGHTGGTVEGSHVQAGPAVRPASYPPALAELRGRVEEPLRRQYGAAPTDGSGDYSVTLGPAVVWVRPELVDGRPLVRVWAITNTGMRVGDGLPRFLLETNARLPFGGLALDESQPAVVFADDLLGDYLTRAELALAVAMAAGATAEVAPTIKDRFGGRLFGEG